MMGEWVFHADGAVTLPRSELEGLLARVAELEAEVRLLTDELVVAVLDGQRYRDAIEEHRKVSVEQMEASNEQLAEQRASMPELAHHWPDWRIETWGDPHELDLWAALEGS